MDRSRFVDERDKQSQEFGLLSCPYSTRAWNIEVEVVEGCWNVLCCEKHAVRAYAKLERHIAVNFVHYVLVDLATYSKHSRVRWPLIFAQSQIVVGLPLPAVWVVRWDESDIG
jgi:hypothetical protein